MLHSLKCIGRPEKNLRYKSTSILLTKRTDREVRQKFLFEQNVMKSKEQDTVSLTKTGAISYVVEKLLLF